MTDKDIALETAFRLTKVASVAVNDNDTLWCVRYYNGSGASTKTIETYVLRKGKFLGRFLIEEKPTFDAAWSSEEKDVPELPAIRKARMLMLGLAEKVWT